MTDEERLEPEAVLSLVKQIDTLRAHVKELQQNWDACHEQHKAADLAIVGASKMMEMFRQLLTDRIFGDHKGPIVAGIDTWLELPAVKQALGKPVVPDVIVCWQEGCEKNVIEDSDYCEDHQG